MEHINERVREKYYVRYMKGNMSEADFKAQAARDRDAAIEQIKPGIDAVRKAQIIE